MGVFTTIAGLVLTGIADQKPQWASPTLIEKLNSLGGWKVPILLFSSVLIVRLIAAPYWIYQKERKKIAALRTELKDIRRHKLKGEISRFMFCEGNEGSGICVMLRIISIGSPTTAHSWSLNLTLLGRELCLRPKHLIDDSMQWPIDEHSFVKVKAEDMIYEKLAKPIAEGGTEVGFLFFPMDGVSQEQLASEKPTLTIRFRDAMQTEYETSADGWGQIIPTHEPGIDDPFAAVMFRQMKAREVEATNVKRAASEKRRFNEYPKKLAAVMDRGRELAQRFLINNPPTDEEIDKWFADTYFEMAFSGFPKFCATHLARFNLADEIIRPLPTEGSQESVINYNRIMSKVKVLDQFVKELTQPS